MLKPTADRVLVRRDDYLAETDGGILLATEEKQFTGTVVATGRGSYTKKGVLVPVAVKAGDRVIFGKWAGNQEIDDCILMSEAEIFGVIE